MKKDNLPKGVYIEPNKRVVANWTENGEWKVKTYSIKKYGLEKACELAIAYRQQKEKELNIIVDKVKNIYESKDSYVILHIKGTHNADVVFDKEDLKVVQMYHWRVVLFNDSPSIYTSIKGKQINLKEILIPNTSIDKILFKDKNSLNFRRKNLKISQGVAKCVNRRKQRSDNKTGKTGVIKAEDPIYHTFRYVAIAQINGRSKTKSFSINKYGEAVAFQMACLARDKMAEEFGLHNA